MHYLNLENTSRSKLKQAFKEAGAGKVKIQREYDKSFGVTFSCPENSSRHDYDQQVPTKNFAFRLFDSLVKVGIPKSKLLYKYSGYYLFLMNYMGRIDEDNHTD